MRSFAETGAALSNFHSLKQAARSARSCEAPPQLWVTPRPSFITAAARRSVLINATAPHCPPRAAKISYLKIDGYLCQHVAETGPTPSSRGRFTRKGVPPRRMDKDYPKWLSLRVATPRSAFPGKATGRAQPRDSTDAALDKGRAASVLMPAKPVVAV